MNILEIHSAIKISRTCCNILNKTNQNVTNVFYQEFEESRPNEKWIEQLLQTSEFFVQKKNIS